MHGEPSRFVPWSAARTALAAFVLLVCPLQGANAANGTATDAVATDSYSDSTGDVQDPKIVPDIAQVTPRLAADGPVTFDVRLAATRTFTVRRRNRGSRGSSWPSIPIAIQRLELNGETSLRIRSARAASRSHAGTERLPRTSRTDRQGNSSPAPISRSH